MHLKYSFTLSSSLWLLSNAAAMPTASSGPGNASKVLLSNAAAVPPASNEPGNFTNVLCSDGDIGNPTASAALRWSEADASDAWEAVERYWNENPASNGLTLVQAVSHYWNGPEGWNCGAVGSDPCDSAPQSCGDKSKASKDIDTPAAWLILQSFSTIHNFQTNQYNAMVGAESAVQGQIGSFASNFAPISDDNSEIEILLDILGAGFSLISAGVWNKVISQTITEPDNLDWAKDSANAVMEAGIEIAKDALPAAQSALQAQNNLASYVSQLITAWQGMISIYTTNLFSGSNKAPSLTDLSNLIANGAALNDNAVLNPGLADPGLFDMQSIIENTIFGLLIPKAWQTSNQDVHPVILLPDPKSSGCTGNAYSGFISNSVASSSSACYNNQAYYLLNVAGGPCPDKKAKRETGPGIDPCGATLLSELPGINTLNGNTWGGVTVTNFVVSAVQGYELNNNQNGYQMPNLTNIIDGQGTQGNFYFENGIQTPGLVTIPVCTLDVVSGNWDNYGHKNPKPAGYPCN